MSRISTSGEWFADWFDSKYYHLLYKNRSDEEAEAFISRLTEFVAQGKCGSVLDLACGAGRHCRSLAKLGFEVTGIDLSKESIAKAKSYDDGIRYEVADMRTFHLDKTYDFIFNLFTSFGYFDDVSDNHLVLQSVINHFKSGTLLVMDYFNADKVVRDLVPSEVKELEGVRFDISREVRNGHICKRIRVTDGNHVEEHEEKVQLFSKWDLEELLNANGLQITSVFGSYELEEFNTDSNRLILIAQKK